MADVVLAIQQIARAGLLPVLTGLNGTDVYYFDNREGSVFLEVDNQNAGTCTVTLDVTKTGPGGVTVTDETIAILTATRQLIGPFPELFEQASGTQVRRIKMSQDLGTLVSAGAFRL